MNTSLVYLNGEFVPPEQARISVFDRGFVFGDGIYEVIPVYSRRPFRLLQHLQRLAGNLQKVRIASPLDEAGWRAVFDRLIAAGDSDDQAIYLQVTRGVAPRDHVFPACATPTTMAFSFALKTPSEQDRSRGVSCIKAADDRWLHCDIKSISLLANVLHKQSAAEADSAETILFRDGMLTEGSASNVFIARDGLLMTPPENELILPGITRDLVLELARDAGVPFAEVAIAEEDVDSADEVMLTSSTKEILPVMQIDGTKVGSGEPGEIYRRLYRTCQEYIAQFRAGNIG